MRPVYTTDEMRARDAAAIDDCGIPGIVLMENAARGAADVAERRFGPLAGNSCLIVCGRGNNGGDGFALARHLINRGMAVRVLLTGADDTVKGDARANLAVLRNMEGADTPLRISVIEEADDVHTELDRSPAFAVDALLGTGLSSPITGTMEKLVALLNGSGLPILAVDVPTGINADTGDVMGSAVRAACTATMGGLKRGLLFGRGKEHAGVVSVIDIGIPFTGAIGLPANTFQLETADVRAWMPRRGFDVHKYQMGKVFALAGSVGYTGAAAMASEAALRAGAGIVKLGVPESLNDVFEIKLTEVMTVPLAETSERSIGLGGYEQILDLMNSATVGIAGPGLSRNAETQDLVRRLVRDTRSPLVLDADALFALAGHAQLLLAAGAPLILTPHAGEFARLIEQEPDVPGDTHLERSRRFATTHRVTLVLKGAPTIIAAADGRLYINPTGNAGMATAGSGDVLTGIIAGLVAQGLAPVEAACSGVFLHGMAGDRARESKGEHGLIATDMLHFLPEAIAGLASDASPG